MLQPRVVVVGAGAFGGWTALELTRRGATGRSTRRDPPRSRELGRQTRIIRATYGTRAIYTTLTIRALALWRAHDERERTSLFKHTGVLWLFGADDTFARTSSEVLHAHGAAFDQISKGEAARRYPQASLDGVSSVYFEPEAGYLLARRACESVVRSVTAAGGRFRTDAAATPVNLGDLRQKRLTMRDGTHLEADAFVFACGPWLGTMFPDAIGSRIASTQQDIYYFGPPAGDPAFTDERLPVWIDFNDRQIYGIPAHGSSGFKIADDASGPPIDSRAGVR